MAGEAAAMTLERLLQERGLSQPSQHQLLRQHQQAQQQKAQECRTRQERRHSQQQRSPWDQDRDFFAANRKRGNVSRVASSLFGPSGPSCQKWAKK